MELMLKKNENYHSKNARKGMKANKNKNSANPKSNDQKKLKLTARKKEKNPETFQFPNSSVSKSFASCQTKFLDKTSMLLV